MAKILFTILLTACCTMQSYGQFPDAGRYKITSAGTVTFGYRCNDWESFARGCSFETGKMKMEVPPWTISGGWHSYFMVDGQNSYVCSTPADMVVNNNIDIRNDGVGPFNVSSSGLAGRGCIRSNREWGRVYYAVYSAQYIKHPTEGGVTLAILHGENKDVCDGGSDCHNTINADPVNVCPFKGDYWPRYNSFVCGSWTPNNQYTNWGQQYFPHDMGPIVWPSTGYLQPGGKKATTGVNHPTSIQHDGYVYVYYHDSGPYKGLNDHDEEGRQEGIKVIRAPLDRSLDPQAWEGYFRDGSGAEHWEPSLPAGFTKERMHAFLDIKGPRATDLMGDEGHNQWQNLRFSVAKVRNKDYFIGVESYIDAADGRKFKTALRFSQDLLHWTDRQLIIDEASDFSTNQMNYPIFLGSDGWSNNVVDEDDFYVLGTAAAISNVVYRKHITLSGFFTFNQPQSMRATAVGGAAGTPGTFYPAPNPSKGTVRVNYTLTEHAIVRVNVLDLTGRVLQKGVPAQRAPGAQAEMLDLSALASGAYLLELFAGKERKVAKVLKD